MRHLKHMVIFIPYSGDSLVILLPYILSDKSVGFSIIFKVLLLVLLNFEGGFCLYSAYKYIMKPRVN